MSKNDVDTLSLRNATMDDEGIAKIKEAVSNSGNLKVCIATVSGTIFLPFCFVLFLRLPHWSTGRERVALLVYMTL